MLCCHTAAQNEASEAIKNEGGLEADHIVQDGGVAEVVVGKDVCPVVDQLQS